ncbi:MAG: hypothetical protein NT166_21790 [Candidatus Aminicenantes bacterium]|nr:hypothetical protein [Candidatus Aminicenantes bacterium]
MNKQIKRYCVTGIIVIFICYFFAQVSFASVWGNWRECVSASGCSCTLTLDIKKSMSPSLKPYILESAGYFLKSHDAFLEFLYSVEMSESNGIDSVEFKNTLYRAVDNMEKAKIAYSNLKTASEKIPYNREMIDQLMKFDYDGFRIKNGLNEPIFEKLRTFLGRGDIAGFDDAIIANMDAILIKLYEIKSVVDKGLAPEIMIVWRIYQSYSEAQLFGQYMSEVFRDILF